MVECRRCNSRDGIEMADPWGLITDALEAAIEKMEKARDFAAERRALDLDNPEDDKL